MSPDDAGRGAGGPLSIDGGEPARRTRAPGAPRRILIVRTSALGDVVHCLPVLTALRRHLRDARIGWVVEEAMAPVLENHPDLDQLLVVRLRSWRRRPFTLATLRELGRFLADLDRFSPEVVFDLMGNHKAGVIAALTLADRRIGLAREQRREPSSAVWISEGVRAAGSHAVDRALSLLDRLALPREAADFGGDKLFRTDEAGADRQEAGGRPFVLIHPGAGWGNKRYPAAWWGEVAHRVRSHAGVEVLVTSGPGEERLAREVVAASRGGARGVVAPTLPALAALARGARLMMGGDSGPLHLAHALGTPVLCLMGPTDPRRNGPYGATDAAVWHPLPCSFCDKRMNETKGCLLALAPAEVAGRALARMSGETRP